MPIIMSQHVRRGFIFGCNEKKRLCGSLLTVTYVNPLRDKHGQGWQPFAAAGRIPIRITGRCAK